MKILSSDLLPIGLQENQQSIMDCFRDQVAQADQVEISVGYVSKASLIELDAIIHEYGIRNVGLTIGMYFFEGMPEGSYHIAMDINDRWQAEGIGEVRIVRSFKYHGKVYCFYKDGNPFSAILGSANLGVLKLEATNRRQFEVATLIDSAEELQAIDKLSQSVKAPNCSVNIHEAIGMPLIREVNTSLNNIENVK